MAKKAILVITDGIGYSPKTDFNAFYNAKKPTYDRLFKNTPHSLINTFGLSVGLPEGQMGNSEVGHMTIGAGRIMYQDLVKISLSLEDKSFEQNEVFKDFVKKHNRIHLLGLVSDGGVHSHIDHLTGIIEILKEKNKKVFIHVITDGRDVSPTSAVSYIEKLQKHLNENVTIATLGGRFYTMDRDNRWERIQRGYDAIAFAKPKTDFDPASYVGHSYSIGETDEFIQPAAFEGYEGMQDGDGVLTFNFRSDRMREIVTALGSDEFEHFERKPVKVDVVTMTEYDKNFTFPVLFKKEAPKNTIAEVVSKAGLRQLHTSETEKYAHVTFFLNGGIEEPFENETRVLIPSPKVKTYDLKPQMSAPEVCEAVLKGMDEEYDFIVVNFANGDMVGHTGNYEAALKAVECVDEQLGKILDKAKEKDYAFVLTSDHGNCEEMKDDEGNTLTNHTVGKVWCFVEADGVNKVEDGGLNNIAPTVLKLMELDIPKEMDHPLI